MSHLRQDIDRYRAIAGLCNHASHAETSMERVFKKICFLLNLKGMTITDWVNSVPYPEDQASKKDVRLGDLVDTLEAIGVKLEAT